LAQNSKNFLDFLVNKKLELILILKTELVNLFQRTLKAREAEYPPPDDRFQHPAVSSPIVISSVPVFMFIIVR